MKKVSNYRIVYVTTDSLKSAQQIAKILVSERYAACCSIISNVTSVFEWEGKINERSEFILMIKTKEDKLNQLENRVRELHNDEVPEIIAVNIENGLDKYLDWIDSTL